MSAKHTPGPWFHETVLGQVGRFESADGVVVAKAQPIPNDQNREVRNANARLIAAAPELLEALDLADCLLSGANMNKQVVERKVKAAIAKATGSASCPAL